MEIKINFTEGDFERLSTNSCLWAGKQWEQQAPGRFEYSTDFSVEGNPHADWDWPGYGFRIAYWMGNSWLDVMFARAFLEAQGYKSEVLFDVATDDAIAEYVILTNYMTESWRKHPD